MKIMNHATFNKSFLVKLCSLLIIVTTFSYCTVEPDPEPDPTDKLAIDSLVATSTDIVIWERIFITAYARGENLTYKWSTNHGSMFGKDSVTVKYWACPSCVGINTVKCVVANEHGTVSDTITINVRLK